MTEEDVCYLPNFIVPLNDDLDECSMGRVTSILDLAGRLTDSPPDQDGLDTIRRIWVAARDLEGGLFELLSSCPTEHQSLVLRLMSAQETGHSEESTFLCVSND